MLPLRSTRLVASFVLSSVFVLALVSGSFAQGDAGSDPPSVTAFVGVHVVPMTDRSEPVLENRTVIVRGDRIVRVGAVSEVDVPEGARRVEGEGRYLIPGMAELHGHVPDPEERPRYTRDVLWLFLANGVTTVRGMLGHPGQLELRERTNTGSLPGPTLYLAGPPFTGGSVDSPEDAAQMVRDQAAAGWDYLKVLEGMNRAEYDAMVEAAREEGMPFVGHVPNDVGLLRVLESGQGTIDHLDGYVDYLNGAERSVPASELQEAVRRTQEAGVGVVPTMALWETLVGATATDVLTRYSELRYMPPGMVQNWIETQNERRSGEDFDPEGAERIIENRNRLLSAFHEADAQILFGTDAPQQFSVPGFSIHREIDRMAEAGMDPYAILHSGTSASGSYFSDHDRFGTIEPDARADLVLLEGNPLEDPDRLRNPAGVMARGRWYPRARLQEELGRISERHAEGEGGDWGQY